MPKPKGPKLSKTVLSSADREQRVREAAYYRWLDRGGSHGGHEDDWLEAEEEMARNVFDHDPEP